MGQDAFDEIMAENSLNLIKEAYPGTASTEGLKQDEPKQMHTKIYHNCVPSHSAVYNPLWPMDCSLPSSSVHVILQARILEWVAICFSKGNFSTQELNPHLLHWHVDSLPLSYPGNPYNAILLSQKKWTPAICSNMDRHREYYT